jgi:putative tryptophan/tyrosine transport system substrate-binding protein
MSDMRRRDFITLLGGAAAAWPPAAEAQQPPMPVVGFMSSGSPGPLRRQIAAVHEGLKETGYVDGQNVVLEFRFAEGQLDRFPALAAELVRRQVAVLMATSPAGALAAKQATTTIPIVFSVGDDPVKSGIVDSLHRPGGNLTGVYQFASGLEAKRLSLLHDLVPQVTTIAALVHPSYSGAETQVRDLQEAASRLSVQLVILTANTESDFATAFATLVQRRAAALVVCATPFFNSRRQQLVLMATRHAVPAIYEWRDFAEAGGLMSYGTRLNDAYRQAAVYAGRILKGAKPAELPVVRSTKFEFVINLQTARALGIEVPNSIQLLADEVIE